jgi:hypothetical protein
LNTLAVRSVNSSVSVLHAFGFVDGPKFYKVAQFGTGVDHLNTDAVSTSRRRVPPSTSCAALHFKAVIHPDERHLNFESDI